MSEHRKHVKLNRRKMGFFCHEEIAIVGHHCDAISSLVQVLTEPIFPQYKIAYIDASHQKDLLPSKFDCFTLHKSGASVINKTFHHNKYNSNTKFSSYDLAFINGNHFEAEKHIVFLNPEKEQSISKRIHEIKDILFFIALEKDIEMFDCIKTKFPEYEKIPIIGLHEMNEMSEFVSKYINSIKPQLEALVLIGGKSIRMGKDKSQLEYYGKAHGVYLFELLKQNNLKVHYSAKENTSNRKDVIQDKFKDLGPFGAICSAFMHNPNTAYLVLATDLPFVSSELIQKLIQERDSSKIATALIGKQKEFPEPLICIWEPKAYPLLLHYLSLGISCPRKLLINEEIKQIVVEDIFLTNINTKDEYINIKSKLK